MFDFCQISSSEQFLIFKFFPIFFSSKFQKKIENIPSFSVWLELI